jgi:3-oxocholest-4-en-26-oyl-CoA dehydrogenase alpha subunit
MGNSGRAGSLLDDGDTEIEDVARQATQVTGSIRAFLAKAVDEKVLEEVREGRNEHSPTFYRRLVEEGWVGLHWPKEVGGRGLSPIVFGTMLEEAAAAGAPITSFMITSIIGSTLLAFGRPEQVQDWIPKVVAGEMSFCLGYSEPDAGSDLASLKTAAVRDGAEYRVSGQKVFTSLANVASHVFLATRTDPSVAKHRGITMILVPLSNPGITITPIWTMGGFRTNAVYYDDVSVGEGQRVGDENAGWGVLMGALAFERTAVGRVGLGRRLLATLAPEVWRHKEESWEVRSFGELAAFWKGVRVLTQRASAIQNRGDSPAVEAALAKLAGTELAQTVARYGMDAVGVAGLIEEDAFPLTKEYRDSLRHSVTGGTSEIQRNIIAKLGLGL